MLERNSISERRGESFSRISSLIASRTETLSIYTQLIARRPFRDVAATQKLLQHFCQSLVDYTANGHFTIYRYIDEGTERRHAILSLGRNLYPRILETTQLIVGFNDKYDCEDHCDNLLNLEEDLSELGQGLVERMELEDQIIDALSVARRA